MSFYGITDFWAYLLGVIAIVILPGPNSMYCLFISSSRGVVEGYKTASAIFIGDLILMVFTVFGGAAILKTSPTVFFIFKLLGGLYLAYLGINLLVGAYNRFRQGSLTDIEKSNLEVNVRKVEKDENVFIKALMLSLSNPKAILFFLSFFLQFVDPHYDNPMLSFAILGMTLQVVSMLYLSILIFTGTRLSLFFKKKNVLASMGNGLVGTLFISFAVSLCRF